MNWVEKARSDAGNIKQKDNTTIEFLSHPLIRQDFLAKNLTLASVGLIKYQTTSFVEPEDIILPRSVDERLEEKIIRQRWDPAIPETYFDFSNNYIRLFIAEQNEKELDAMGRIARQMEKKGIDVRYIIRSDIPEDLIMCIKNSFGTPFFAIIDERYVEILHVTIEENRRIYTRALLTKNPNIVSEATTFFTELNKYARSYEEIEIPQKIGTKKAEGVNEG